MRYLYVLYMILCKVNKNIYIYVLAFRHVYVPHILCIDIFAFRYLYLCTDRWRHVYLHQMCTIVHVWVCECVHVNVQCIYMYYKRTYLYYNIYIYGYISESNRQEKCVISKHTYETWKQTEFFVHGWWPHGDSLQKGDFHCGKTIPLWMKSSRWASYDVLSTGTDFKRIYFKFHPPQTWTGHHPWYGRWPNVRYSWAKETPGSKMK